MFSLGGTGGSAIQVGSGSSNLEVYMNSLIKSGNVQLGFSLTNHDWNHILLTYDAFSKDGYELKYYLNGQFEGESGDFGSSLVIPEESKWILGTASAESPELGRFIGDIDDVRVFSTTLGQDMATYLFNEGISDHGLTVETYAFDPVQDPMIHQDLELQLKFKRYGEYLDLDDMNLDNLQSTLQHPTEVNGVKLWLDATDISTLDKDDSLGSEGQPLDNDSVGFWMDKSGHNHHAIRKAGIQFTGLICTTTNDPGSNQVATMIILN